MQFQQSNFEFELPRLPLDIWPPFRRRHFQGWGGGGGGGRGGGGGVLIGPW